MLQPFLTPMNVEMFLINLLESGQVCDMIRFKMENRSETY